MIPRLGRLFLLTIPVLLLFAVPRGAFAESAPLRMGLLPTVPTLSLLRLYDPLRQFLQKELGRPIELYTAPDFKSYLNDISQSEFDIIIAAPHFGVVAYDRGYVPLVRYQLELRPLIIVPKGSDLKTPSQLRGKRVLTADRLAALSVVAEAWLKADFGLRADVDYLLEEAGNHATAIRAVAIGEADAAFSGLSPLQQVPVEFRERVDSIPSRLSVPHQFTMAHPRLGAETILALRGALARFAASDAGRKFFKTSGFLGVASLGTADIERARPYADLVLHRLGRGP